MANKKDIKEAGKIIVKVSQLPNKEYEMQSEMVGFQDPESLAMALGSVVNGLLRVGSPDAIKDLLKQAWKLGNQMHENEKRREQ